MGDQSKLPASLLHGVYNLTDLLGELPLAEPSPDSLNNQEIVFDQAVCDEFRRVLQSDGRSDVNLLSRLCINLGQTDSSHILSNTAVSDSLPPSETMPPLLKSILTVNPNAFKGPNCQQLSQIQSDVSPKRSSFHPPQNISHQETSNVMMNDSHIFDIAKPPAQPSSSSHSSKKDHKANNEEDEGSNVIKAKKKKKKELDQLALDNRNLAKYDARYPDYRAAPTTLFDGYSGDAFVDKEIDLFSDTFTKKPKKIVSHAQRDSASLNVMAEQGLPDLQRDDSSLDIPESDAMNYHPSDEHMNKLKRKKRDKDENERLTVRLQLAMTGGNEDLIENVVYRNFIQLMEDIFRNVDDANLHDFFKKADEDAEIPNEALISRGLLSELVSESSKLCELGATSHIDSELLSRILTILQWNVRHGASNVLTKSEETGETGESFEREMALFREVSGLRIIHSVDACLGVLYILTAPNLPGQLYTDEVLEPVVNCIRFQLHNSIFGEFDPLYRSDAEGKSYGNLKSKRSRSGHVKDKLVVSIYQKIVLTVDLLANLVSMHDLGDTLLIKLTSVAVSPFFVENIAELQLASLRLVVSMFAKHEKIRQFILDDVLSSLTKLPSTKRNLRSYRLWNHSGSIQMVTALVLNMVQCMAKLPVIDESKPKIIEEQRSSDEEQSNSLPKSEDPGQVLQTSFDLSRKTAVLFITAFFKRCTQKSEDDYRPLFENFVQDLLATAQRPEWPATDMMLTLLGSILVQQFTNRNLDTNIRVAALDYFGQVAARLRRDNVSVSEKALDSIVEDIRNLDPEYAAVLEKTSRPLVVERAVEVEVEHTSPPPKRSRRRSTKKRRVLGEKNRPITRVEIKNEIRQVDVDENVRNLQLMQMAFSNFLENASQLDPTLKYAGNLCLSQWHVDAVNEADRALKLYQAAVKSGSETTTTEEEINAKCQVQKQFITKLIVSHKKSDGHPSKSSKLPVISHETACTVALWLGKQRSFAQSFEFFLTNILNLLDETTIAVRTRAIKSLALVVEADPAVLNFVIVRKAVHGCFGDGSTSVREAAVDLIGRFILHNSGLTLNYYPLLCERINDVGVSVRKRVLKIFRDICLEQPDFPKIADLCKQMISRIGDEESIRKLVTEAFQHMWFQQIDAMKEPHKLLRRVTSVVDVVSACREIGYDWFHQLLEALLKKADDSVQVAALETSKQIVDGLIEHTVRCEEVDAEAKQTTSSSIALVSTLTALSIFCRAMPTLLVPHVRLLHPYLNIKCSTQGDYLVIINTCKILELAVPLMANPSPEFVKQLEGDLLAIASKQGMAVLESVIACLGAVVNKVTQRHQLVIQSLEKLTNGLHNFLTSHRRNPQAEIPRQIKAQLLRNLYLIGLLCKNFDYEAIASNPVRDTILQFYLYFCVIGDDDIKHKALMGLGFFCTRYFSCMLSEPLKNHYQSVLTNKGPAKFRTQVLKNILAGLQEQEAKPLEDISAEQAEAGDAAVAEHHPDTLKEMFDVQAGLAATVAQTYLNEILKAYFDADVEVRSAAADVMLLIVAHGLIHPAKCVPYLVAACTDSNQSIRSRSELRLKEIDKRYPNFISMKAIPGVRKSYELQKILRAGSDEPIRGLFANVKDDPSAYVDQSPATLAILYQLLRVSKANRRAFVNSLIKLFDECNNVKLAELVYVADNLVYLPYGSVDEILQTVFQIEQNISISGTNLIQSVKDLCTTMADGSSFQVPDDEEEFFQPSFLMDALPADLGQVHALVTSTAQNSLLLLTVKGAIKEEYGLTDAKVRQYAATCTNSKVAQKLYDKPAPRRQVIRYTPAQLDALRQGPPICPAIGDNHGRQMLVSELVQFKQLLDSLDQDAVAAAANDTFDADDLEGLDDDVEFDDEGNPIEKSSKAKKSSNQKSSTGKRSRGKSTAKNNRTSGKKSSSSKKKRNVIDSDPEEEPAADEWAEFAELADFDDNEPDFASPT